MSNAFIPGGLIAIVFISFWLSVYPREFIEALTFHAESPWISTLTVVYTAWGAATFFAIVWS